MIGPLHIPSDGIDLLRIYRHGPARIEALLYLGSMHLVTVTFETSLGFVRLSCLIVTLSRPSVGLLVSTCLTWCLVFPRSGQGTAWRSVVGAEWSAPSLGLPNRTYVRHPHYT